MAQVVDGPAQTTARPAARLPPGWRGATGCRRSGRATPTWWSSAARARGSRRSRASATWTTPAASRVTNTGHAHPRVAAAIAEQAGKIIHAQQNILYHQPGLELHERLPRTFPGLAHGEEAGLFLSNSGAEAIEAAVKLAKYATRRPGIIAFRGGFHGRTHGAMSLTSSGVKYRGHYEPLLAGVHFAAFPYPLRNPTGRSDEAAIGVQPGRAGGAVRHASSIPEDVAALHRGADPGRGRLRGAAGRLPARAARDRRPARHPAHRRRGADRRRPHRPHVGQRVERRAARHPGHGQGHRLGHAAVRDHGPPRPAGPIQPGLPRRHLRRQRGRLRGGAGHAGRDRRRRACSRTPGARASGCCPTCAALAGRASRPWPRCAAAA